MLKKGDIVEYKGVVTTCLGDEFQFLGAGPLVVVLEDFEGWINASIPKPLTKLEILNSMEIVETDGDGESLYYVLVDYNEENLNKLAKVIPNLEQYLKDYGDIDDDKSCIEISNAAWQYANAKWFTGEKFLLVAPIGECDWCGETASELSGPHTLDFAPGKKMCRGCWEHDRQIYLGSVGTDIGEFVSLT